MLAARVDKKKIFEYSAILGIIFLIIIYIILTTFVIKPSTEVDSSLDTSVNLANTKEVNELEIDIIEDPKFKNLQEATYQEKDIDELSIGKKDPFDDGLSQDKK